jgi:hypothetical protein
MSDAICPSTQARINEIAGRGYESIELYKDRPRRPGINVERYSRLDTPYRKPRRYANENRRERAGSDLARRIMPEGKSGCSMRKSGGIHS